MGAEIYGYRYDLLAGLYVALALVLQFFRGSESQKVDEQAGFAHPFESKSRPLLAMQRQGLLRLFGRLCSRTKALFVRSFQRPLGSNFLIFYGRELQVEHYGDIRAIGW